MIEPFSLRVQLLLVLLSRWHGRWALRSMIRRAPNHPDRMSVEIGIFCDDHEIDRLRGLLRGAK